MLTRVKRIFMILGLSIGLSACTLMDRGTDDFTGMQTAGLAVIGLAGYAAGGHLADKLDGEDEPLDDDTPRLFPPASVTLGAMAGTLLFMEIYSRMVINYQEPQKDSPK